MKFTITLIETIEITYQPVVIEAENEEEAYIQAKNRIDCLDVEDKETASVTYEVE